MKRSSKIALGVVASIGIGLAVAGAFAHSHGLGPRMMGGIGRAMIHGMGPGTVSEFRGPMAGRMQQGDAAFGADMQLVRDLVHSNERIDRTVTNLPNGIKTVTESDDPRVAQTIKAHVASMMQRLSEGKQFNLFSKTIPVLFDNKDKIKTTTETTEKGAIVTQTSTDAKVIMALQEHATEVDELVRDGMVAMMRNMRANMAMMQHGPGVGFGPNFAPSRAAPAR